jgi:hypothetical protein
LWGQSGTLKIKKEGKQVKKLIIVLALALVFALAIGFSVTCFAANPPGTVTINAGGSGANITVVTAESDGTSGDTLTLTTPGVFSLNQVDNFASTTENAYTSNNGEISRVVAFGTNAEAEPSSGTITTATIMDSTAPYALYDANLSTDITVTGGTNAGGYLQQGLAFSDISGSGVSGVSSYYYYPYNLVDNTLNAQANGSYTLDVNDVGAEIGPSLGSMPPSPPTYSLDVNSVASSGTSTLAFTPTDDDSYSGSAAAGGLSNTTDHGENTTLTTNFALSYSGTPAISVTAIGPLLNSLSLYVNNVTNTVTGSGDIQ